LGFLASTQPTKLQKPNYQVILFYVAPVLAADSQLVLFYLMVFKIAYAVKIVLPRLYYDNTVLAACQEISFF
jgi:hypothetical protein